MDRVLGARGATGGRGGRGKWRGVAKQGVRCMEGTHRGPRLQEACQQRGKRGAVLGGCGVRGKERPTRGEGRGPGEAGGRDGDSGQGEAARFQAGISGTQAEGEYGGLPRAGPHPRGARSRREEWGAGKAPRES